MSLRSGLIGLLMKSILTGESFAVSRISLALGGAVSPESVRPQLPEHQEYRR